MKIDKSLFRGKDIGFITEVVNYIESFGLKVEFGGSVVKNTEKGNLRQYNDIDIRVFPEKDYDRYFSCVRSFLDSKRENVEWKMGWDVRDLSTKQYTYMEANVDYRFMLRVAGVRTPIDVTFGWPIAPVKRNYSIEETKIPMFPSEKTSKFEYGSSDLKILPEIREKYFKH